MLTKYEGNKYLAHNLRKCMAHTFATVEFSGIIDPEFDEEDVTLPKETASSDDHSDGR